MIVAGDLVGKGQVGGVEDPGFGAEIAQQARGLLDGEPRERAGAQRAVQQQDARRMRPRGENAGQVAGGAIRIERGQEVGVLERADSHDGSTSILM